MKRIFLCASEYEAENIFQDYNLKPVSVAPYKLYGTYLTDEVLITGEGTANAAAATQFILEYAPDQIINVGLASSLTNKYSKGKSFIINACSDGYNIREVYKLNTNIKNIDIPQASLISGDSFVPDKKVLAASLKKSNPTLVDAELASIAHILDINGTLDKLIGVKAISQYLNKASKKDSREVNIDIFTELREIVGKLVSA